MLSRPAIPESLTPARHWRSMIAGGTVSAGREQFMRAIRNAKPVSIVAGSTLILEGCVGMWLAATAPAGPGNDKIVLLSFFYGAVALIWGVVILSWRFWSKPMVLMRRQVVDVLPAILPLAVVSLPLLSGRGFSDPANPSLWMGGLLLASAAISVVPAEKAALLEIPPLRPGHFLDWLRWQNFGASSLWVSGFFTATYFFDSRRLDAFTPLIIMLALAQATVSVWRIIEQRQFSKVAVRLSNLQIN
ncbi:hypothetical protein [Arthrobacter sp. FW306-2-2C-D06B]|uniref:hypothetical protein n=1 Tax=Arthrobacter sp. FW306-2-2C-D06B TaxID=2879618 RepID=UPI001F1F30C1|nr:hypothetical protein [Arthrobacter sp. FW306-2-2C-D06B]UKA57954.1 hypothetical protein LFT47_16975 [Arthrobacter sp. FW306-2-2C-D06B]